MKFYSILNINKNLEDYMKKENMSNNLSIYDDITKFKLDLDFITFNLKKLKVNHVNKKYNGEVKDIFVTVYGGNLNDT